MVRWYNIENGSSRLSDDAINEAMEEAVHLYNKEDQYIIREITG